MATEVTETISPKKLVIQFKRVGDDIQVHKVKVKIGDDGDGDDIPPQLGYPNPPTNVTYPLAELVKYKKNPICIGFMMGGSYYEICFEP